MKQIGLSRTRPKEDIYCVHVTLQVSLQDFIFLEQKPGSWFTLTWTIEFGNNEIKKLQGVKHKKALNISIDNNNYEILI